MEQEFQPINPFIRFETKKLLFNPGHKLLLPHTYPCFIHRITSKKLQISDGLHKIDCKFSAQAHQKLYAHLMINNELNTLEGQQVLLLEPHIKFCMKRESNEQGVPKFQTLIRLIVGQIEMAPILKSPDVQVKVKSLMQDEDIRQLMQFKMIQLQKEQLSKSLAKMSLPPISIFNSPSIHSELPHNRKVVLDSSIIILTKQGHSGFEDFSQEDVEHYSNQLSPVDSPQQRGLKEDVDSNYDTFKMIVVESTRRLQRTQAVDSELLELLQRQPDDDADMIDVNDTPPKSSIDSVPSSLGSDSRNVGAAKGTLQGEIGFGLNTTQNQNDFKGARKNIIPPSVPSQGDLLDLINSNKKDKEPLSMPIFDNLKPPAQVKISPEGKQLTTPNTGTKSLQNGVNSLHLESPSDLPQADDEIWSVELSKEHYDQWLSNMTESKFHSYEAWFAINIKRQNEPIQALPAEHDYRITTPLNILNQLRDTAHRRNNPTAVQQPEPVPKPQPVMQQLQPNMGFGNRTARVIEPAKTLVNELNESKDLIFPKKRKRQNDDTLEQISTHDRTYKKIKGNDGLEKKPAYKSKHNSFM